VISKELEKYRIDFYNKWKEAAMIIKLMTIIIMQIKMHKIKVFIKHRQKRINVKLK